MRVVSIVVGLSMGAGSLIWLGNRGPAVLSDGDHPLPSATARYERPRASGASRFLPSFFGGASTATQDPSRDDGSWIEVPVLAVDVHGRPLAGAEIETRATEADLAAALLAAAELDARFAADEAGDDAFVPPVISPRELSHARKVVFRARTGGDGRARVKVPPRVEVTLLARGASGEEGISAPLFVLGKGDDVTPPAEVTIETAPLAVLVGDVRDERGRAIAEATVTIAPRDFEYGAPVPELVALAGERGQEGTVYTDANGAFRIPLRRSGAYDVTVEAKGFQLHSEPAAQAMAGHDSTLRVTMLEAAVVRGRILDASGAPLAVAYADLRGVEEAAGAYHSVSTMADGSFLAEGLPPGKYELRATATDHQGARADVRTGEAPVELRLQRGTILSGTVVADLSLLGLDAPRMESLEDSVPAASVFVMVRSARGSIPFLTGEDPQRTPIHETINEEPRSWTMVSVDAGGRGTFEVPGLPPGDFLLFLQYGSLRTRPIAARLASGATARVQLHLDRASLETPPPPQIAEVVEVIDLDTLGDGEVASMDVPEEPIDEPPPPFLPDLRLDAGPTGPFVVRAGLPSSGPRVVGGDRIVAVAGTRLVLGSAEGNATYEAQQLLMGAEGSTVSITVERPATGETLSMTFVRTIAWEPPRHGCHFGREIRAGEY